MNDLSVAVALATAPYSAFAELRERPRFWFPLLLVVLTTAAMLFWYYSVVDIDWLKDLMYGNNPAIPEAQRSVIMSVMNRSRLLWSSVIGVVVVLPVITAVTALYWLLAAKVTKLTPGYKHWFAFTCWTALPVLISHVVAAILLLIRDTPQIGLGVLQPLSLNELVFHLPMGSPAQNLLGSLAIPAFLGWVLQVIGVHVWSQRSWLFGTLFVLLPNAVFFGVWAILAFR